MGSYSERRYTFDTNLDSLHDKRSDEILTTFQRHGRINEEI